MFSVCGPNGGVTGLFFHHLLGTSAYEIQSLDGKKHILTSTEHLKKRNFKCGISEEYRRQAYDLDSFFRHHHHHKHGDTDGFEGNTDQHRYPNYSQQSFRSIHVRTKGERFRESVQTQVISDCVDGNSKYLDVLVVNDFERASIRGENTEDHTATIFSIVHFAFAGGTAAGLDFGNGIYDGSTMKCRIQPRWCTKLVLLCCKIVVVHRKRVRRGLLPTLDTKTGRDERSCCIAIH